MPEERIIFDTDQPMHHGESLPYSSFERGIQVPTMVRWVLATQVAKDEAGAKRVLIGVVVAALALTLYLLATIGEAPQHPKGLPAPPPGGWQIPPTSTP